MIRLPLIILEALLLLASMDPTMSEIHYDLYVNGLQYNTELLYHTYGSVSVHTGIA